MLKTSLKFYLIFFIFIFACRDKYVPKLKTRVDGWLVVEGFINVGNGPTQIQLTRSTSLDSTAFISEVGAQVEVESNNGLSYPLTEQDSGKYTIGQLPVNPGQQYRLHIKTASGKDYVSDYSTIKITPPIDAITWKADNEGVRLFVSTHDPENATFYYQWQFEETWSYRSVFISDYIYDDGAVLSRPDSLQFPQLCYLNDHSTNILIASSAKLSSDIISEFPLTKVFYSTSNKLTRRYSILVKQNALSREWYEWKLKLKKNTEELGSIFDAQPSETGGNIHCVSDPAESVIGFVGCSTETEKRIFIDRSDLPNTYIYSGYEGCLEVKVKNDPDSLAGISFNTSSITHTMGDTYLFIASNYCIDCRLLGGDSAKPAFWEP